MTPFKPSATDQQLDELLRRSGPMNLPRAYEVMAAHGLQGLVLGDPLNVYHMLGYWPQLASTKTGQPPSSFVLLSRDPSVGPGFVTTQFVYYYTWADARIEWCSQVWLYGEAGDDGRESPVPAPPLCADRHMVPVTDVERRRRAALDAIPLARQQLHDAGAALVRAMRELGLWHGKVAADHAVIAAVCEHHQRPGSVVAADNIVREIRLVKSPLEIQLMSRAAQANVSAVHAVAQAVRAGASYSELRSQFAIETARRGNREVFLTVDRVSSELADERIREGQVLFIDGVSHFRRYHGDYARTVFVGQPPASAQRAVAAAVAGWNAVRDCLRPGLKYSDIVRIGTEAVKQAGYDGQIGFGPHSVGLMHTDEPGIDAQGFLRKADLVLQPNMILSVDCPVMDTGIGGSAHFEDLMLITANGATPLHAIDNPVIQL